LVPGTGRCEYRPVPVGFSAAALGGLGPALARRARAAAVRLPQPAHLLGVAAGLLLDGSRREVVDGGRRLRLGALVGLLAGVVVEVLVQLLDGLCPGQFARLVGEHPDLVARAVRDQCVDQRLHEPLDAVGVVLGDRGALALRRYFDGRVAQDDVHDRLADQVGVDDLERLADARFHHLLVEVGVVEARRAPLELGRVRLGLGCCHGGAHVELLSGPLSPSFEAFPLRLQDTVVNN
jgi:hypothetical protein